jgi:hypothetical protein
MLRSTGLVLIVTVGCAGTRHIDPPPPPTPLYPAVALPPTPPDSGTSRVVFDVVDGPTQIQIKSAQPGSSKWQLLCAITPCAADLQPGQHEVSFVLSADPEFNDYTTIITPPGTTVYRRQLGIRTSHPVLLGAGYAVAYTGLLVLMIGGLISALEADQGNGHAGSSTALVGLGMMAGGGAMFYFGWPSEQPGSVTQFAVPPRR